MSAARGAFQSWRRKPIEERIAFVRAFAKLVEARKADMAAVISRSTGKPLWDTATEAAAMVGKAELSVKAYAERTPTKEAPAGAFIARISHHPHGVMAVLGPFNFPGHLPNGHIMPSLIAGNTIIFKPSEQTPDVAEFTVRLWEEAGLPPGVVNLVQGARGPAELLVAHDHVDGVLFTGGMPAGKAIHKALGGKLEKIVALELGGNNPLVVWDVGNLDSAAKLIVKSAYVTSGQRCTCSRRLIVKAGPDGDRVLEALARLIDRLTVGLPDAPAQPFIGPVISARAADAVLAAQADWLKSGGIALREARRLDIGPAFVSPGLIDVTAIAVRKDEEVFGPLLQVIRVKDFDAALDEANNTRFGLAAGLISDDTKLFERFEAEVLKNRRARQRSLLATLLLSAGTPMILSGDESGRTQQGNNNTYCQDNELNWIDWTLLDEDADGGGPDAGSGKGLWEATKQLIALRAEHPALRRRRWLTGHEDGEAAVRWLHPDGHDMADGDWDGSSEMAMLLDGTVIPERGPRGEVIRDDRILLLIDAGSEPTDWSLPPTPGSWVEQFSSALGSQLNDDGTYRTPGRSVVVFVEAAD